MNQDSSTGWHQPLQDDPMLIAGEDDFSTFLQLGIDFPGFDETQGADNDFDPPMGDLGMDQLAMDSSMEELRRHNMHTGVSLSERGRADLMHGPSKISHRENPVLDAATSQCRSGHQQPKYQTQKQPYAPRVAVPPTPQSSEIQGAAVKYYHYIDGDGLSHFEPYPGRSDEQMTFTPLVSPAVTPIDPPLRFPEATVRGEYFSPLTSPAIQAQNVHSRRIAHRYVPPPSNGSITSPTDQAVETPKMPGSARSAAKRDIRRPSVSGKSSGRIVRQSPLARPQARRKQSSLNISPAGLAELAEKARSATLPAALSPNLQGPSSHSDGSGQSSSISPEPLSDALMPPPTLPRSAGKSPTLAGKSQAVDATDEPATPATLMKLPSQESSPQTDTQGSDHTFTPHNEVMEDIMLPESAATAGLLPLTIDTSPCIAEDQLTPTLSAKTPKLSATSTPHMSAMRTQGKSPSTDLAHKRTDSRSGHASKTRQGGTQSHVSPAIRPRISPSIKPLMPQSNPSTPALSAETSALYLASKSNYQNILEGTHLPGISYPDALAENLSSKRTSHKLAEQGRRNRINVALKEMESLLPSAPVAKGKRDRSGSIDGSSGDKSAAFSNSKASTVELAIGYIKTLQAELSEARAKLEHREKDLAETKSGGALASESPQSQSRSQ